MAKNPRAEDVLESLTLADLLRAFADARRAGGDRRPAAHANYDALVRLFGVDLFAVPATIPAERLFALALATEVPSSDGRMLPKTLHALLLDCVDREQETASPFDGYLEAPPAVIALYRVHGKRLAAAARAYRTALRPLTIDLLRLLYDLDPAATVDRDLAVALGWSAWDPFDI